MPPGFNLPLPGPYSEAQMDIWLPLDMLRPGGNPLAATAFCYARLRPGVTLGEASAELKREAAEIVRRDPASPRLHRTSRQPSRACHQEYSSHPVTAVRRGRVAASDHLR
jgi:hypothetical protein